MIPRFIIGFAVLVLLAAGGACLADEPTAPAPNGINLPEGYKDWRLIGVSHRTDNGTLRAILGNDIAIKAARHGQTRPWPHGAVFAKVVLKDRSDDNWPTATVPGQLVHVEFMIKDATKYASTLGWGFARWLGGAQTPYGDGPDFAEECVGCHQPLKDRDYVFTTPISLP